ncbi:hypothetical protein J6590_012580 [Homalodisca vitripennis]|nr:hypothetical protein J6590_012580 [Homalodisca vitripennis]
MKFFPVFKIGCEFSSQQDCLMPILPTISKVFNVLFMPPKDWSPNLESKSQIVSEVYLVVANYSAMVEVILTNLNIDIDLGHIICIPSHKIRSVLLPLSHHLHYLSLTEYYSWQVRRTKISVLAVILRNMDKLDSAEEIQEVENIENASGNMDPEENNSKVSVSNGEDVQTTDLVDSSGVHEIQFAEKDNYGTTETSTTDSTEEFQRSEGEKRDIIGNGRTKRSILPDGPKLKCPEGKARDPWGICKKVIYSNNVSKNMKPERKKHNINEMAVSNSGEDFPTSESIDSFGEDDRDNSGTIQTSTSDSPKEP